MSRQAMARRFIVAGLMPLLALGCSRKESTTIQTDKGTVTVETDGDTTTVTGADGEKATVKSQGGTVTMTTDRGTFTSGSGRLPEGFPLPQIDGARIQQSAHMTPSAGQDDPEVYHATMTVDLPPAEAAAFYEKALKDKGFEVSRMDSQSGDEALISLSGTADSIDAAVVVTREASAPETTVSVHWSINR